MPIINALNSEEPSWGILQSLMFQGCPLVQHCCQETQALLQTTPSRLRNCKSPFYCLIQLETPKSCLDSASLPLRLVCTPVALALGGI